MQDTENNQQNDFMIEKIKERPVNKKKLLRRTIITASMAVIFGLIACFTFLVLEPVISNWLYPEEDPKLVVFPEDQEEMSPEEMLYDNMQQENQKSQTPEAIENFVLQKEQIQQVLDNVILDKDNYKQMYYAMSEYVDTLERYMVTVTGVSSNTDWFNEVEESKNQSYGVVIANNGKEVLILADYNPLKNAESLTASFYTGAVVEAQLKAMDATTGLAVISVTLENLGKVMYTDSLKIATLGSSNVKNIVGIPVIALGNPMGVSDSVGYGMITAASNQQPKADTNYKLLMTDIVGSQSANGVLFNLNGQVVGIITDNKNNSDMKNVIAAYGISGLKKRVEKMSNGQEMAYLGISGVDVTKEVNSQLNVPYGAFITDVEMDSPSMLAGIQKGDIIVAVNGTTVFTYGEYTAALMQMNPGDTVEIRVMRLAQDEYKEMNFKMTTEKAE